jgi:hypothetical protein
MNVLEILDNQNQQFFLHWTLPQLLETAFAQRFVPKMAFTLPGLGQYKWKTSPMGLLGCPASFQRLMILLNSGVNAINYK